MEDSHPVHDLPEECGFVNLKLLGLALEDRVALYFYWPPGGNTLDAEQLMIHEGCLYFWRENEWWRLDTRDLDLSGLSRSITLLPLPEGMSLDAVQGAVGFAKLSTYTVPIQL